MWSVERGGVVEDVGGGVMTWTTALLRRTPHWARAGKCGAVVDEGRV